MRAMPSIAWWTPSPFRRQSRKIFQLFMRAKACSTRARTLRWECCVPLSGREFGLASLATVWDDQTGSAVAAVRDDRGAADGCLRSGQLPGLAVLAVAGDRPADPDDEPGVGIDDDLVVGRVPVVLRLLRNAVITLGDQGAVHDQHGILAEPLAVLSASDGPRWSMMRPPPTSTPRTSGRVVAG